MINYKIRLYKKQHFKDKINNVVHLQQLPATQLIIKDDMDNIYTSQAVGVTLTLVSLFYFTGYTDCQCRNGSNKTDSTSSEDSFRKIVSDAHLRDTFS